MESNAKLFLPNRVIQAFSPFTFEKVGYPTRITDYRELWCFHDVMQENRFQGWLRNYFPNGMSTKEFDMFGKSINITNEYGKLLAADVQPRRLSAGENSLITSLYNWRNIHALLSLNNKEFRGNTFEVGPGNGYLSLLLAMSGYRVTALENTQAFYLYQKGLFQFTKEKIGNATYEKPKHICWWEFPSLAADAFVDADIVIANHMLNEMHIWALRFLLSKISTAWNSCCWSSRTN